jgi:hypothetical protein
MLIGQYRKNHHTQIMPILTLCRTSREGVSLFFGIGSELSAGGNGIVDRPFFRDSTVFRRYCSLKVSFRLTGQCQPKFPEELSTSHRSGSD